MIDHKTLAYAIRLAARHRCEVSLSPDGMLTVSPQIMNAEPTKVETRSARNRKYYESKRLKASESVLNASESVLNASESVLIDKSTPSPSPPSPDPSLPAHTPAPTPHVREAPVPVPETPTPKTVRQSRSQNTAQALAEASTVELDMLASPALKAAWRDWQLWRSTRNSGLLTGESPWPWTLLAAQRAAKELTTIAAQHGETAAVEAVALSISQRWQGIVHRETRFGSRPTTPTPPTPIEKLEWEH